MEKGKKFFRKRKGFFITYLFFYSKIIKVFIISTLTSFWISISYEATISDWPFPLESNFLKNPFCWSISITTFFWKPFFKKLPIFQTQPFFNLLLKFKGHHFTWYFFVILKFSKWKTLYLWILLLKILPFCVAPFLIYLFFNPYFLMIFFFFFWFLYFSGSSLWRSHFLRNTFFLSYLFLNF